ncbi:hypothetical protein [Trinickia acidisoli]|uniref:hypothetical protein n=1 Tax=Trinickia acidisoli TaxID=2767482 RepID=UPI001A90CC14|nr:hypothetical protein [Trinickia acidisoli]
MGTYRAVGSPVGSRSRLPLLARSLRDRGIKPESNQSPLAEEEFIDAGLELVNYQQDFLANETVRVSFVALDSPAQRSIAGNPTPPLRVATLDEIFALECLVCAERANAIAALPAGCRRRRLRAIADQRAEPGHDARFFQSQLDELEVRLAKQAFSELGCSSRDQ